MGKAVRPTALQGDYCCAVFCDVLWDVFCAVFWDVCRDACRCDVCFVDERAECSEPEADPEAFALTFALESAPLAVDSPVATALFVVPFAVPVT